MRGKVERRLTVRQRGLLKMIGGRASCARDLAAPLKGKSHSAPVGG